MRIIKFEAENVKRLHAVSITPTGDIVEISGANGNGKTSCLDAVWWALTGTGNVQAQPIRRGAEKASIRLDMGELIVTRSFKRQEGEKFTTSLKVENAEGASYKSPQSMLDALYTGLTLDPIEFSRMKPKDQFDMLRGFVPDVDFQKIDDLNRGDFERRSSENRRMEEAKAAAGLISINPDLPHDEEDESPLLDQIANAGQHNSDIGSEILRRNGLKSGLETARRTIASKREEAARLRQSAEALEAQADAAETQAKADAGAYQALPQLPEPIDIGAVRQRLSKVQEANAAIRKAAENRRKKSSLETVASDAAMASDQLTAKIKARNKAKNDAIAAAQMPVPGLGFGDGFVTLNGLPFDQASDAEKLRASIAIAMHTKSKLRVIRVRDGSLLDDASMAILAEMAAAHGAQVWIETVRAVTDSAVIIEDGRVKGAAAVAEEEGAAA